MTSILHLFYRKANPWNSGPSSWKSYKSLCCVSYVLEIHDDQEIGTCCTAPTFSVHHTTTVHNLCWTEFIRPTSSYISPLSLFIREAVTCKLHLSVETDFLSGNSFFIQRKNRDMFRTKQILVLLAPILKLGSCKSNTWRILMDISWKTNVSGNIFKKTKNSSVLGWESLSKKWSVLDF